ncbi:MAG TPA: hypothetical protein DEF07_01355 [Nitrosomonas sp.]|uniref:Uncharacterized protein n=1 Tax=Nitrosomonas mobilis TaxID=51642 RepID=A0A1G5SCX9_9PROT|nr:conjugative transfer protein MobI(A/C) [Nitrosomonas mobilis]SCZ85045.1 hypothetical protein NSMM_330065 [Nitrosomonas mobilis]HBV20351.1 hypothetical protein [Nitrosomonas sp.]HNO75916.1 conjugative transfer protein MobI(A/C) [Nitrosomonas mobilis]
MSTVESETLHSLESLETIWKSIEIRIDELEKIAASIIDRHWELVMQSEKAFPGWQNRSNLNLRIHRKGNNLRIDWTGIKWSSNKDGKKYPLYTHISKGKGKHTYTLSKLYSFAKEWEKPLIAETEKELAWIRRESFHLNRSLFSIRYAKAAAMRSEG